MTIMTENPERLERAQKAAALMAARVNGDRHALTALSYDIGTQSNLIAGLVPIIEQMAVDLGELTDRTPGQVLADIAVLASLGQLLRAAHPSSGGADGG